MLSKTDCSKQGSEVDRLLSQGGLDVAADGVRLHVDGSGSGHHVVRGGALKTIEAMRSKTRDPGPLHFSVLDQFLSRLQQCLAF